MAKEGESATAVITTDSLLADVEKAAEHDKLRQKEQDRFLTLEQAEAAQRRREAAARKEECNQQKWEVFNLACIVLPGTGVFMAMLILCFLVSNGIDSGLYPEEADFGIFKVIFAIGMLLPVCMFWPLLLGMFCPYDRDTGEGLCCKKIINAKNFSRCYMGDVVAIFLVLLTLFILAFAAKGNADALDDVQNLRNLEDPQVSAIKVFYISLFEGCCGDDNVLPPLDCDGRGNVEPCVRADEADLFTKFVDSINDDHCFSIGSFICFNRTLDDYFDGIASTEFQLYEDETFAIPVFAGSALALFAIVLTVFSFMLTKMTEGEVKPKRDENQMPEKKDIDRLQDVMI